MKFNMKRFFRNANYLPHLTKTSKIGQFQVRSELSKSVFESVYERIIYDGDWFLILVSSEFDPQAVFGLFGK